DVADAMPPDQGEATVAPPNASTWNLEGLDLRAPPDRVFVSALARDLDGDGNLDVVALVAPAGAAAQPTPARPPRHAAHTLDVVVYRGQAQRLEGPSAVATAPPLTTDASCAPVRRLARIGKRSVFLEVGADCTGHAAALPARWIAVVMVDRAPRIQFS